MRKLLFLALSMLAFNLSHSQTVTTQQVVVNSQTTVTGCGTINFGTTLSNSVTVYFKISKTGAGVDGTMYLMLKNSSGASTSSINNIPIQAVSWTPGSNSSTIEHTIAANINYDQVATSGGELSLQFITSGNQISNSSCVNQIIRTPQPEFSLSPTSKTIACGSTETVQFTVTNVYNSQTVNSYKWNVGSGWVFTNGSSVPANYTTPSNTLSLKPNPNGPYPPQNVSVTPKLNGVDQPMKTCVVSGTNIVADGTITGLASLCSGSSTYTFNNALTGQTITWSVSDPTIASLSTTTGTTTTVTKTGDGPVTLSAVVSNSCGQSYQKNKDIYLGVPKPFTIAIGLAEEEYCDIKYHYRKYKINNYNPLLTYTTTVTGPSPKYVTSFAGGFTIYFPKAYTGYLDIVVKATNSCGSRNVYFEDYTGLCNTTVPSAARMASQEAGTVSDGVGDMVSIYPNPATTNLYLNLALNNDATESYKAEIIDILGATKGTWNVNNGENSLDVSGLSSGIYLLKVKIKEEIKTYRVMIK